MFTYYLELAVRSLRRSPGLTALMILAIGFGVAASMTTYSVFRGLSADPIPWKSSQLFVPQIDAWGPEHRENGEPPTTLTYIDAMNLMRQHRASRQSAIIPMFRSIMPPRTNQDNSLIETRGYAVYSEFFPMLDVPFHYGSGWSRDDDATPVVVISDHFNEQMFGGGNSVGKTIAIDNRIIASWVLSSTGIRNRNSSHLSGINPPSQTFFYRLHSRLQTTSSTKPTLIARMVRIQAVISRRFCVRTAYGSPSWLKSTTQWPCGRTGNTSMLMQASSNSWAASSGNRTIACAMCRHFSTTSMWCPAIPGCHY